MFFTLQFAWWLDVHIELNYFIVAIKLVPFCQIIIPMWPVISWHCTFTRAESVQFAIAFSEARGYKKKLKWEISLKETEYSKDIPGMNSLKSLRTFLYLFTFYSKVILKCSPFLLLYVNNIFTSFWRRLDWSSIFAKKKILY